MPRSSETGEGSGPIHLALCIGDLCVMYSREVAARVGELVLDALDCFGPDSPEDAAIRSELVNHRSTERDSL